MDQETLKKRLEVARHWAEKFAAHAQDLENLLANGSALDPLVIRAAHEAALSMVEELREEAGALERLLKD